MKGEHSLRRRSLGIFFMALAAILGIQTLYFFNVLSTNRRTAAEYADFSAQQVSSVTQQLFDNYHHALWQLGQSRDAQNLLVDSDPYSFLSALWGPMIRGIPQKNIFCDTRMRNFLLLFSLPPTVSQNGS